jgi:hypothetical protein
MAIMAIEFRATRRPLRLRGIRIGKPSQRTLGLGLLACGIGMVPWLFVLGAMLPGSTRVAWVGLDSMEAIGLASTGWLLLRDDPRRSLTAMATSALLVTDAWFDMTTATTGGALAEAIAMAVLAEIPMATLCVVIAYRGLSGNSRTMGA